MKIKMSRGERIFQVFNYSFLTLLSILCLYPLWHVLMASFSDHYELLGHSGPLLWPLQFTTQAYERVLANPDIFSGYVSTIKLLVIGTAWQMLITILCAYVLSCPRFLLRRPLMLMITFTMFFSGGTIPFYMNLRDTGMLGTFWGLIIPNVIFNDYMNCNWAQESTARLVPLIDKAAELGAETFCIDDGWQGVQGIWYPADEKFDGGLQAILDYITEQEPSNTV